MIFAEEYYKLFKVSRIEHINTFLDDLEYSVGFIFITFNDIQQCEQFLTKSHYYK